MSSSPGATAVTSPAWTFVDTTATLAAFVDDISSLPTDPPSLYVDLEGVKLSRHGTVSLLNIFVLPLNHTYLIDTHVLGLAAFDSPSIIGSTLRTILESSLVPKVFFDVRNDSDALYSHYGVFLANVHDIQLLELAAHPHPTTRFTVSGLATCIARDVMLSADEAARVAVVKAKGVKLFASEMGGSYEVFNVRPLAQDLLEYCINDVVLLPRLWKKLNHKLSPQWARKVVEETDKRIACSLDKNYQPGGRDKVLNPWYIPRPGKKKPQRRTIPAHASITTNLSSGSTQLPSSANAGIKQPQGTKGMTKSEAYPCASCSKSFKTITALSQHGQASHSQQPVASPPPRATESQSAPPKPSPSKISPSAQKENAPPPPPPPPPKKHTCSTCVKTFRSKTALSQHNRDSHATAAKIAAIAGPSARSVKSYSSQKYGVYYGYQDTVGCYGYDGFGIGGGEDYGLCDKDCGWCGHCGDGIL